MSNVRFKTSCKNGKIKEKRWNGFTVCILVFLILYCLILFGILLWGILTAFKSNDDWSGFWDATSNHIGLPRYWIDEETGKPALISNIEIVIQHSHFYISGKDVDIGKMILYSLLYALGCAFTNTLVPFVTAYACAKYKNVCSKILVAVAIAVMAIPIVGSLPSELKMAYNLGLYDSIWGQWVMKANFLGVYFLVFYASFSAQPLSYKEAAEIDGANDFTIMTRIFFPLCSSEFATVMLINFITYWNDYQTPNIFMPSYPTLSYNIWYIMMGSETDFAYPPTVITAAVMLLIPVLILFLIFQKRLLKNIDVGGIKG